jgi:hypothetical protein
MSRFNAGLEGDGGINMLGVVCLGTELEICKGTLAFLYHACPQSSEIFDMGYQELLMEHLSNFGLVTSCFMKG